MPRRPSSTSAAKKKAPRSSAKKNALPAEVAKALRQFEKLLGGSSPDDVNALLASLNGPSAQRGLSDEDADAKDRAQELAFDAMEAATEAQARKLAKRALQLDPDCVDALVVMIDVDARTPREMIEGLQRAVAAGERSLGAKFIRENKGHFWLLLETRPYMRAMAQLASLLRGQGIALDAARIYERMLELNPNDNQGVRDPLLGLYLQAGDLKGATGLLKKYKQDGSANFAWARVLERFLSGDRDSAAAALKKARKANPHVELYLAGQKALPGHMPEMYSPGSDEEAVLCLDNLSGAWAEHKEVVLWMFDEFVADGLRIVPSKAALKKTPIPGAVQ